MIADVCAVNHLGILMTNQDVHISYLPLPHMFERAMQCAAISEGAAIGFYQV